MNGKIRPKKSSKKGATKGMRFFEKGDTTRKRKPILKLYKDGQTDDGSSSSDGVSLNYSSQGTDDTNDTSSNTTSDQVLYDEEQSSEYYQGNILRTDGDESSSEGGFPSHLKNAMHDFRKQFTQAKLYGIHTKAGNLSGESRENGAATLTHTSQNEKGMKHNEKSSREHDTKLSVGKKRKSKADKRVPLKEEALLQKSSNTNFSDYSRSSHWKSKEGESKKEGSVYSFPRQRRTTKIAAVGLAEARKKSGLEKISKAKERRNKLIDYLCQIEDAGKALQPQLKTDASEVSDPVFLDTIASRNAVLRKYGFELTSNDDLLKLGGAADRKRRREKKKIRFSTSSSSSSSDSNMSLDVKEVQSTLKSFLGKRGEEVDVDELKRHGRKWHNCIDEGHCVCRLRNEPEEEAIKEDHDKKYRQFLNIFDGKDTPYHEYTKEELLKAHEKIGPWVHNKTKRLEQFLESNANTPEYILNIWDGTLSGESSGSEPDFEKHRLEYKKKLERAQEDGTVLPQEDRVPTLEENNWFLFPTPVTRMYGTEGTSTSSSQKNSRAAMEAIVSDLKRKKEIDRALEFLRQGNFPEAHLYPRPIQLAKETSKSVQHPLLGLFPAVSANKNDDN